MVPIDCYLFVFLINLKRYIFIKVCSVCTKVLYKKYSNFTLRLTLHRLSLSQYFLYSCLDTFNEDEHLSNDPATFCMLENLPSEFVDFLLKKGVLQPNEED